MNSSNNLMLFLKQKANEKEALSVLSSGNDHKTQEEQEDSREDLTVQISNYSGLSEAKKGTSSASLHKDEPMPRIETRKKETEASCDVAPVEAWSIGPRSILTKENKRIVLLRDSSKSLKDSKMTLVGHKQKQKISPTSASTKTINKVTERSNDQSIASSRIGKMIDDITCNLLFPCIFKASSDMSNAFNAVDDAVRIAS